MGLQWLTAKKCQNLLISWISPPPWPRVCDISQHCDMAGSVGGRWPANPKLNSCSQAVPQLGKFGTNTATPRTNKGGTHGILGIYIYI